MTKLSDLNVGDKFEFSGSSIYIGGPREYFGVMNGQYVFSNVQSSGVTSVEQDLEVIPIREPQYRPFTLESFLPHRDKWLRWKDDSEMPMRVQTYNDVGIWPGAAISGQSWQEAFEKLEFEDGTPFGELVE